MLAETKRGPGKGVMFPSPTTSNLCQHELP